MKARLPELGDWASPEAAIDQGRAKLRETIAWARQAPFYSHRLPELNRWDDEEWQNIPLTTKADLRAAYPFGLCAIPRHVIATYHESSGTSGEPTASYFSEGDWEDISSRFARNAVNLTPHDAVMVKTPYSMVTTAHQMHYAARYRGAMVVPADNRSSNMPYSKVVRLLRDIPVTIAWCMPTEVLLWAAAARLGGYDPAADFPALRAFLVAGEAMSGGKRRRMEQLWGARIFEDYGSTETGSLAGECPSGRMHLWADRLYFEIYDEKNRAFSTTGQGQLVVTTLFREAMPLVRYGLEDTVRIGTDSCACGWQLPTIEVVGRTATLAHVRGRALSPKSLEEAVYALPVEDGVLFWRARHDDRRLTIEIEALPERATAACERLRAEVFTRLGIYAEVCAVSGIVSPAVLTQAARFTKPRFLFEAHEEWAGGIHY